MRYPVRNKPAISFGFTPGYGDSPENNEGHCLLKQISLTLTLKTCHNWSRYKTKGVHLWLGKLTQSLHRKGTKRIALSMGVSWILLYSKVFSFFFCRSYLTKRYHINVSTLKCHGVKMVWNFARITLLSQIVEPEPTFFFCFDFSTFLRL